MSDVPTPPRRRDLLTTAALALTAGGAAFALWPLMQATMPDAETRARRRLFNISVLPDESSMLLDVDAKPVLVFRRSQEELAALEASHADKTAASDWRNTPQRSPRAGVMACIAKCTVDQCVVVMNTGQQGRFLICPCCASRFDLSARRLSGPAPTDLMVPEYRFISSGEIEFTPQET
jgi:ubiquinol-cytochrome c reductase iron-sulfur subunit